MIFALLTWMLAGNYYPAEFQDWPPLLYWVMGAVTAIMLFVGVLLHEQEPPTMLVTPENNRRNRNHALAFAGMMAVPLAVAGSFFPPLLLWLGICPLKAPSVLPSDQPSCLGPRPL